LRASQQAVDVISQVLCFVHSWLNAVSIARLEAIGLRDVSLVIAGVNTLAHLVLIRSCIPLCPAIKELLGKGPGKPVRPTGETMGDVLRLSRIRRYQRNLSKTVRQKFIALTTIMLCATAISNDAPNQTPFKEMSPKDLRALLFPIFDQLLAMALCPMIRRSKRVDETLLWASAESGEHLGFDVAAVTAIPKGNEGEHDLMIGRGALSIFSLILQGGLISQLKMWLDTIDKQLREQFANFVQQHVSEVIVQQNFAEVLSHSPDGFARFEVDDHLSVVVQAAERVLQVTYKLDDEEISVRIALPSTFPLDSPQVGAPSAAKRSVKGISNEQWRSWMLKMTMMLFNGNSSLWDCIKLFGENISRHFEGVEPCPICFAVVSAASNRLPEMKCSVCRNSVFHASCLSQWWSSTGQSSCPMCRSPWMA
jgi:hypothetical protein